jgi:aquaporin Z
LSNLEDTRKYVAELIGTFVLVFMGCGSAVIAGYAIQYVGISFAFGLSVLVMVYAIGGISGCHINPAVSIAMFAAHKMKLKDLIMYVVMQCLGATVGAAALSIVATGNPGYSITSGLGQNGYSTDPSAGYPMVSAFIAETLLTFIFLLVIFGSTSEKAPKDFAGISIGLSLVLIHLVGIPITGTSVNPARSLGPAFIMSLTPGQAGATAISQLWLFWAAPILGALIAALVWKLFE